MLHNFLSRELLVDCYPITFLIYVAVKSSLWRMKFRNLFKYNKMNTCGNSFLLFHPLQYFTIRFALYNKKLLFTRLKMMKVHIQSIQWYLPTNYIQFVVSFVKIFVLFMALFANRRSFSTKSNTSKGTAHSIANSIRVLHCEF